MSSVTPGYALWADLTWRDLDLLFQGKRRLQELWGCCCCSQTSLEHLPWEGLNCVPAEHLACPQCNQQYELQTFIFMGYITLGAFQVYEHLCWKCQSWDKNECLCKQTAVQLINRSSRQEGGKSLVLLNLEARITENYKKLNLKKSRIP